MIIIMMMVKLLTTLMQLTTTQTTNNMSTSSDTVQILETVKNLLLENEPLVKASYYELLRQAQQSGLLDKAGRLVFSGNGFTINLIPQALFFLGWLAVLAFLIYGLSDEYSNAQAYASGYDYSSYKSPPSYTSMSSHYLAPEPPSPTYSTSAFIAPSDHYHTHQPTKTQSYPASTTYSYSDTPVYLPELDTLSYGDSLYGSEYKTVKDVTSIQARLQDLEEELQYLKTAETLIRRGELTSPLLQYSY